MATWSQVKAQLNNKSAQLAAAMVGSNNGQPLREPDPSIYANQADLYHRISWVYGAISAKTRVVGSLANFQVMTLDGENKTQVFNHEFEQLLRKPNPYQFDSKFEFFEALIGWLSLNGNIYIYPNAASPQSPPAELWLLRPDRVLIVPDKSKFVRGYIYEIDNTQVAFDADEIVHIKTWNPLNDYYGLSAIEALALATESDYSQAVWNRNFFGKDNAKPQGGLAYADTFDDDTWTQMKKDINTEYGGVKRRVMMLRGVGAGGVQWINMGLSQKDMEFLSGRQFSKEEIYGILAPGLVQMLDKNATEANSVSGERTFREYAIYPDLVRIAEKFTAKLLPRYGDNLVGEFEEIRIRDRNIEIVERAAYATVHTVAEVRKKFDNDKPLGDERDNLFPSQVGAQSAPQPGLLPGDMGAWQKDANNANGKPNNPADQGTQNAEDRQSNATAKTLDDPKTLAAKADERKKFKNVLKHDPERAMGFDFKFLDADEQAELRAAARKAVDDSAIDPDLREQFASTLKQVQDALSDQPSA